MTLAAVLEKIRNTLRGPGYPNESAVSQGAIVPVLRQLGWPEGDTSILFPEYGVGQGSVDFALCPTPRKPSVFVEVKKPGRINPSAEQQLFNYAFHQGVPLALLTDSHTWHFFLPLQQGSYAERLFYTLNLLECDIPSSENRLRRYLEYEALRSGKALAAAKEDHEKRTRARRVEEFLPQAWTRLLSNEDEMLVKRLTEATQELCDYSPPAELVQQFLRTQAKHPPNKTAKQSIPPPAKQAKPPPPQTPAPLPPSDATKYYFDLDGTHYETRSAADLLEQALIALISRGGEDFAKRFAALSSTGNRPFIASSPEAVYPDNKDLRIHVVPLSSTHYTSTYLNNGQMRFRLEKAQQAASSCGIEFRFSLPNLKPVKNS